MQSLTFFFSRCLFVPSIGCDQVLVIYRPWSLTNLKMFSQIVRRNMLVVS